MVKPHAEMLKTDLNEAARVLTELYKTIWDEDIITSDWAEGLIIQLIPKDNLHTWQQAKNHTPVQLQ